MLGVGNREAGEERLPGVGGAVAVVVAQEQNVRRLGQQDAVSPRQHGGGILQPIGEQCPGFVIAVEVLVGQALDATKRRRAVRTCGVATHLDDIHRPIGIERDTHRVDDGRFTRRQLEP